MTTEPIPAITEAGGVRELKTHATQLVRRVREGGAEFVVTVNGEPVAIMRPLDEKEAARLRKRAAERWPAESARVAEKVSKRWPPGVAASEAVDEGRRDL